MEELRSLLEGQLAEAETRLDESVSKFLAAKKDVITSKKDVDAYRKALEAATRNNGHPYIAQSVKTDADPYLDAPSYNMFQFGTPISTWGPSQQQRLPLPPLPPKATKQGTILKVIVNNPGLVTKEIFKKIEAKDLKDMDIAIDDLYRALPRLIRRGFITRDDNGQYFPTDSGRQEAAKSNDQ